MMKRFWKVLALSRNQYEIEWNGKTIVISKEEKRLAQIAQCIMEFIPLFTMFFVVGNPQMIPVEGTGTIMGFLVVSVIVFGVFLIGCVLSYLIWRIGVRNLI